MPTTTEQKTDVEVRYSDNPTWHYYITCDSREKAEKWVKELETNRYGKVTQARIRPQ